MAKLLQIIYFVVFINVLNGKVFAGRLEDELEEILERDVYYDGQEPAEYVPPALIFKKSGFWNPHPSDYNPMRRPGQSNTQNSPPKRGNTYHPLARTVEAQQKKLEELESQMQSKRQSPGSYLLLKLGKTKAKPGRK